MNRTHLVAAGVLLVALAAPAAAQSSPTPTAPPYYNDSSGSVDSGAWLSGMEDASLEDIVALSVRIGPFIIGTGTAQGGVGSAGVLLTGALVGAIVLSTGIRIRAGPVGGAVLAVATTFVFVAVGIGPTWLYAIALFGVGLVTTAVLVRIFR